MVFHIKMNHLRLALTIAVIGFLFTSKPWLQWLNTLSPEGGLLVKNIVAFLSIYALHFTDGVVAQPHLQAFGILMMYTAFMMIFNYQSDWIKETHSHNVEQQTPDGAVYHRSRTVLGMSPEAARFITFVIVPFVLVYSGSILRNRSQRLNL